MPEVSTAVVVPGSPKSVREPRRSIIEVSTSRSVPAMTSKYFDYTAVVPACPRSVLHHTKKINFNSRNENKYLVGQEKEADAVDSDL